MKPAIVADEMFPEGAGPYMDLEEVFIWIKLFVFNIINIYQAGGSSGLLMDLTANEKAVHADFFNGMCSDQFLFKVDILKFIIFVDFEDLYDEEDLN